MIIVVEWDVKPQKTNKGLTNDASSERAENTMKRLLKNINQLQEVTPII